MRTFRPHLKSLLAMSPQNVAAWIRAPKADLEIDEAPYNEPGPGEILIKVSQSISTIHISAERDAR